MPSGPNRALRAAARACAVLVALWGCADEPVKTAQDAISEALRQGALGAQQGFDYTAAAAHYQRLYEIDPADIDSLVGFGRNLRYAGQPRKSVRALEEGIKKHGDDSRLLLELGKSQLAAAFINDARETLARTVALIPEDWDAHSVSGIIEDRLGNHAAARKWYGQALALSAGNIAVLNNLALSLAQDGQLDEAVTTLEGVVNDANATAQARQNLAMLYALKGDYERAERLVREDLPADMVKENMATYRRLRK